MNKKDNMSCAFEKRARSHLFKKTVCIVYLKTLLLINQ